MRRPVTESAPTKAQATQAGGGGGSVSRPVPVNDPTAGTDTTTTTPGGPVTTLDDEALRGEGLPDEDGG